MTDYVLLRFHALRSGFPTMKIAPLVLLIGGCLAAFSLWGADAAEPPPPKLSDVIALMRENRVYAAIQLLDEGVSRKSIPAKLAAQFMAVSGDTARVAALLESKEPVRREGVEDAPDLANSTVGPALSEIVNAARDSRVVMLNEDHSHQRHRAFAFQLLIELRKQGFTHFGAETFSPDVLETLSDGAPDTHTGIYTFDPLFADMARQAVAMGYSIFPYEQRKDQEPDGGTAEDQRFAREKAQAENVLAIIEKSSAARIFIYAGSGHISEIEDAKGGRWMAHILKERSGIDPLTINQVYGTPRSLTASDSSLYKAVDLRHDFIEPVVVRSEEGFVSWPGFDLSVFHPRERILRRRPEWLLMGGYRKMCRMELKKPTDNALARAFVASEPDDSIPMDQILLPTGSRNVEFRLPEGDYSMVLQDAEDDHLEGHIRVTAHADDCKWTPVAPADGDLHRRTMP